MTLRVVLSIVPGGNAAGQFAIGNIDICNMSDNIDGTSNYAVIMQKCEPFGDAFRQAVNKGIVTYDERGMVVAIDDYDDDDIKVRQVRRHDRLKQDATDLLFSALVALGYSKGTTDVETG